MTNTLGARYLKELEDEATSSRKCIERVPESLYKFKSQEKSMEMGYLTLLVADIPLWIAETINTGVIDFQTWNRFNLSTTAALVAYFDENMSKAKEALQKVSDEELLNGKFILKSGEQIFATDSKDHTIGSSINHLVHHRGQLTVYMRLNNLPVPSIYGPSADDKTF